MMNNAKVLSLKNQLIELFLVLITFFLFLQPSSVNAFDCRNSHSLGYLDQYYTAAVQQYNQGDYVTALLNFRSWWSEVLPCQDQFEKSYWDNFQRQYDELTNFVRTCVDTAKHSVLNSYYSQSGGGFAGKGDSGHGGGSGGGKVKPYFSPNIIRR